MRGERDIERAVADGERNVQTAKLIHNWCAHIRILRDGARGMVEQMTGAPIGHASVDCEFAKDQRGLMTWDWAEAAISFHDRNCVGCEHRKPVGLPNISKLVEARDRSRAQRDQAANEEKSKQLAAYQDRELSRSKLKEEVSQDGWAVIELLAELDDSRLEESTIAIQKMASVAPEVFVERIRDHLGSLIENAEWWAIPAALGALNTLEPGVQRVVRLAAIALENNSAIDLAAKIVSESPQLLDADGVRRSLPALVNIANPARDSFSMTRHLNPLPLMAVSRHNFPAVEAGIKTLLNSKNLYRASLGARAIVSLVNEFSDLGTNCTVDVTVLVARAEHLFGPDLDRHDEKPLDELEEALSCLWRSDPVRANMCFDRYFEDANEAGQGRLVSALARVVKEERLASRRGQDTAMDVHALRQLIRIATTAEREEVLKEVQYALHYKGAGGIAIAELEALLGAAAVVDGRIDQNDQAPIIETGQLGQMQQVLRRQSLTSIRESLVQWAAEAAGESRDATTCYLDFLTKLPENREQLAADLIESLSKTLGNSALLQEVLPCLYSSLFGRSVVIRGASLRALKDMPRARHSDLPDLVFEGILVCLQDPFRYVHKMALRAVDSMEFPESFRASLKERVLTLFLTYAKFPEEGGRDFYFFSDLASTLASRFMTDEERLGDLGKLIVESLRKDDPSSVARELYPLSQSLARTEGFVDLLLDILVDKECRHGDTDKLLSAFERVPKEEIAARNQRLVEIGKDIAQQGSSVEAAVELLIRGGDWSGAIEVVEAAINNLTDLSRDRVRRSNLAVLVGSLRLERSVSLKLDSEVNAQLEANRRLLTNHQTLTRNDDGFDPLELFGTR